ncbi:MAG: hypothetical protein IBJ03_10275 [Gemmatimonadaceae bacterium]|nr:hypothetical protein [Gemmatimonadaceae bacterium]
MISLRRTSVLLGLSSTLVLSANVSAQSAKGALTAPPAASPGWSTLSATALVDSALTRMGGAQLLSSITTMRADVMTQWKRTVFDERPGSDIPSYERHVDLRDYGARRWRNTRTFIPSPASAVDIVDDTVGARTMPGQNGVLATTPLNVAYIDERRQIFAFTPERTMLLARAATDLRRIADTTIDGIVHARVTGTAEGYPATWFLRRTDRLPTMVRYRSDDTNDFGLAPWALHDVEVWYANWARVNPGVMLPRQRDVHRAGRAYKRMTMMTLALNVAAPRDSFAIADSTVQRYLATERRPMWQVSLDSAQMIEQTFASFPRFLGSSGAVRIGGEWVLFETAQSQGAVQLVHDWLTARTGSGVKTGIVARPFSGNGGARWFTKPGVSLIGAPGAAGNLRTMQRGAAPMRLTSVSSARWVRVGNDSLWMEPVDLPDAAGTLLVYSPTLRWIYNPVFGVPLYQPAHEQFVARLRARGLPVEWVGSTTNVRAAVPAAAPAK